jgi:outer membrane protein OmpA-like peptidoglycan-associated protein
MLDVSCNVKKITVPSTGLTNTLDHESPIRVQHVPDTWETPATVDGIFFDLGSSIIDDAASEVLQRHAAKLKATPELHVTLIAHTDNLGSSSLELAKGQDRLGLVKRRLEELKVPAGRIRTENHGSESRADGPCTDDECRRKNRRVDFLFHR